MKYVHIFLGGKALDVEAMMIMSDGSRSSFTSPGAFDSSQNSAMRANYAPALSDNNNSNYLASMKTRGAPVTLLPPARKQYNNDDMCTMEL